MMRLYYLFINLSTPNERRTAYGRSLFPPRVKTAWLPQRQPSVNSKDAKEFLFDNHIQGEINAMVHIGLYYDNELVSILSMGKSRFDKEYEWEVLRFCTKVNNIVIGGFSKLYKYFLSVYKPENVISYVDRRYGSGNFYTKFGFKYIGTSPPSYFYTKTNRRENRMKYQKHMLSEKLETYDPILTEWENMQLNGYDRIWDCGNHVYIWESGWDK
jgi:hypothetical protein